MASVSEDLTQMSAQWLLKALEALGPLSINAVRLVYDIGADVSRESAHLLVNLINHIKNKSGAEYDARTQRALNKLEQKCKEENASSYMITISKSDLADIEKWLKKQDATYVACTPKKGKETIDGATANMPGAETTTIFFMDKDAKLVENAVAICAYQKGLINVLPPEAFFLLHDNKKDISVVDGLDVYELNVFRELAKKYGLGCTEMENGPNQKGESTPGTYKVVCGKEDANKLKAIMRLVSWTMTGDEVGTIKEKVKERLSISEELRKLISEGVKDEYKTFTDETGRQLSVENAKYIVNAKSPSQYIKVTANGFHRFKGAGSGEFVSIDDPDYEEKLEDALSEYSDFAIFDSVEWEAKGLEKSNLRKDKVLEKLSVLPPQLSIEKEESDIRKAHKKRIERGEPLEESAWLFHKYDPDGESPVSEVIEDNYNAPSKPLEEVVSIHYNSAVQRSEKFRYYDVESDERSVDNIILAAKERVAGNMEYEQTQEKETVR